MTRSKTWLTNEFPTFLQAHASEPFAWGQWDCCFFAANAIQAFTGVDIAEDFRGKYTDEASAFATIKIVTGGSTVEDALVYVAKKYDLTEWPKPLLPQRGDLVLVRNGENLIAGVVDMTGCNVVAMGDGVVRLPLSSIQRAWHVPA